MTAEELVEQVARAHYEADPVCGSWDALDAGVTRGLKVQARAALHRLDALGLCIMPKEATEEMAWAQTSGRSLEQFIADYRNLVSTGSIKLEKAG